MKRTLTLFALLVPSLAFAQQQLSRVSIERSSINVGEPARITVESSDGRVTNCGLLVIFGDGEAREYRVGADPMPWSHQYEVPGRYGIRVEPKTVLKPPIGLALPCTGDAQTVKVTVLDPNDQNRGRVQDLEQQRRQLENKERDLRAKEAELERREKALVSAPPVAKAPSTNPTPPKKAKGDKPVVF